MDSKPCLSVSFIDSTSMFNSLIFSSLSQLQHRYRPAHTTNPHFVIDRTQFALPPETDLRFTVGDVEHC